MTTFRKDLTELIRPHLRSGRFPAELVEGIDALLDCAGVPRDCAAPDAAPAAAPDRAPPARPVASLAPDAPEPARPPKKLDVAGLRAWLDLPAAGRFDAAAGEALFARLSNTRAPALTDADFDRSAAALDVPAKLIRAVNKIEAPRGAFDERGRPSILYEKHVFARNSGGRFNASHPILSAKAWQPGSYGPYSIQYRKLAEACALDPDAAFKACSWGAFQILGENAVDIGYSSALDMALALTAGEAAHLDSFVRFITSKKLVAKLRACKAGDPASCIPFVKAYNGTGYARNKYHIHLAAAAR